ncbi:MAG: LytR C-terminal domain-containing protein [Parcubacteria group bacterium]|jgi:hypothetical protein
MDSVAKKENKDVDAVTADEPVAVKKVTRRKNSSVSEKTKSLEMLLSKDRKRSRGVKKKKTGKKMVWMLGSCLAIILVAAGVFVAIKFKDGAGKATAIPEPIAQPEQIVEQIPVEVVVETLKEETTKIDIAALKVKVLNEGAAAGLAGKVKTALVTQGYAKAEAGNGTAEGVVGNFVYYSADKFRSEAEKMAEFLVTRSIKSGVAAAVTDEQRSGDIVVVLGK